MHYIGDDEFVGGEFGDEGGGFTEVTEESWWERLKNSIGSVLGGLVLFLG